MLELDTRIGGGKTPINGGAGVITLLLPGTNPLLCLLKARNAPGQALTGQHIASRKNRFTTAFGESVC